MLSEPLLSTKTFLNMD